MAELDPFDPEHWCSLDLASRRRALAYALERELDAGETVNEVGVEIGPVGREYDLTAVALTDVGRLRTPLWSHARATLYCDLSLHEANRRQIGPSLAVVEAADRLRRRLSVPYQLASRGLTFSLVPEDGVTRSWTAEHSALRKRTAVVREDRVERAGDVDVRDLLAHFYTGPSLRLVGDEGDAFLLPAGVEPEGPLATLCHACRSWSPTSHSRCPECGSEAVDTVVAAPVPRR